jgi:hypothetical protein
VPVHVPSEVVAEGFFEHLGDEAAIHGHMVLITILADVV